jgi:ATP-dependent exoDNAse (exonuclease V) beta subunit
VARDRTYAQRREVVEAGALVRAVLDPNDQIALVATLRAAWAGVPDAAWRPLWDRGLPQAVRGALDGEAGARERLHALVREAAAAVRPDAAPGLDQLAGWDASLLHALDVLVALRRSFETEPAEPFLEKLRTLPLLDATEGARFLGAWRLANLDRFFRELGALLEQTGGDAAAVLRWLRRDASREPDWEEGRPQDAGEDAVQVMTIHGAKGLDFEHVYVLQLHKGRPGQDDATLTTGGTDAALEWRLRPRRGLAIASLGFDRVREHRERVETAEAVRTLYVAMTRAKRRLVLAGRFDGKERDGSHAALLAHEAALEQALAAAREAAGRTADGVHEQEGVRWRILGFEPPGNRPEADEAGIVLTPDAARVRRDSERLRASRRAAAARAARPLGAPASEAPVDELREAAASDEGEEPCRPPAHAAAAEVAAAVGTAVHAFLERFAWSEDAAAEWERGRERLLATVTTRVGPELAAAARERAERVLGRLARGPLWKRLRELEPHVVGRELPILVPAPDLETGPVAFVAGAIDLVHRDPADGSLVVVDFKTDALDQGVLSAEKRERYRAQASTYARAVQEGLGLSTAPRVELWFLDAGERVPLGS